MKIGAMEGEKRGGAGKFAEGVEVGDGSRDQYGDCGGGRGGRRHVLGSRSRERGLGDPSRKLSHRFEVSGGTAARLLCFGEPTLVIELAGSRGANFMNRVLVLVLVAVANCTQTGVE